MGRTRFTSDVNLLKNKINSFSDQWGGTNIGSGLNSALSILNKESTSDRKKIIILLSDGVTDNESYAYSQADTAKASSITIHTIGLGSDVDKNLMQAIADKTSGVYKFSPTAQDMHDIMHDIGGAIFNTAGNAVSLCVNLPSTSALTYLDSQPQASSKVKNSDGTTTLKWTIDKILMDESKNIILKFSGNNLKTDDKIRIFDSSSLTYTDSNNNIINTNLDPLYIQVNKYYMSTNITLDKASYTSNENVNISATIKNLMNFQTTLENVIDIVDENNNIVSTVQDNKSVVWDALGEKNISAVWNSKNTLTGKYYVRVTNKDGENIISTEKAPFNITADGTLSNIITTDKAKYDANDKVKIDVKVSNKSTNKIYNDVASNTTITDSNGKIVWSNENNIHEIVDQNSNSFKLEADINKFPAGKYTANNYILIDGTEVCRSSAEFEIQSSIESGTGLSGNLSITNKTIYQYEDLVINTSLINAGNSDIENAKADITIINSKDSSIAGTITKNYNLPLSQNTIDKITWSHNILPLGNYLVVYTITLPNGKKVTLGEDGFEVKQPLEVSKVTVIKPRILIYDPCSNIKNITKDLTKDLDGNYKLITTPCEILQENISQYNMFINICSTGCLTTASIVSNLYPGFNLFMFLPSCYTVTFNTYNSNDYDRAISYLKQGIKDLTPKKEACSNLSEIEIKIKAKTDIKLSLKEQLPEYSSIIWQSPVFDNKEQRQWLIDANANGEYVYRYLVKVRCPSDINKLTTSIYAVGHEKDGALCTITPSNLQ